MIVTENIDRLPVDDHVLTVRRDERLLHIWPDHGSATEKLWSEYKLLGAVKLAMQYQHSKFSPPKGIFRSADVHIEYQTLNGRQPFYHRNTDVDEITYHVCGSREVMTELGTVETSVGDMLRIPVGVAHDNHGEQDVHLIFYIPQAAEAVSPYRLSEYLMPPFRGWREAEKIEMITDTLGSIGSDVSTFYTSEKALLDYAKDTSERLQVLQSSGKPGPEWLYKSQRVWLGIQSLPPSTGAIYTRHTMGDEIQIQVQGKRRLLTQRGTLFMEPGDAVRIPLGCAFTSVANEDNRWIAILSRYPLEDKMEISTQATPVTSEMLSKVR